MLHEGSVLQLEVAYIPLVQEDFVKHLLNIQ